MQLEAVKGLRSKLLFSSGGGKQQAFVSSSRNDVVQTTDSEHAESRSLSPAVAPSTACVDPSFTSPLYPSSPKLLQQRHRWV